MLNKSRKIIKNLNRLFDKGEPRSHLMRMDKNERTLSFDQKVLHHLVSKIESDDIVSYTNQNPLYKKLARNNSIEETNLLLSPGSDSALKYIFESFIDKNDIVSFIFPTYAMVEVYCELYGAKKNKIKYSNENKISKKQIIKSLKKGCKLLYIANPNQPTGTSISDQDLNQILSYCYKKGILVILDQAYREFSLLKNRNQDFREFENLILIRTFSKAHGLAGIRIGYIIASEQVIKILYKVKPAADINSISIKFATYIIDNPRITSSYVNEVKKSKKLIINFCKKRKINCINTQTNFIYIKGSFYAIFTLLLLKKYNISVTYSKPSLPKKISNSIRLTVGSISQTKKFLKIFDDLLKDIN